MQLQSATNDASHTKRRRAVANDPPRVLLKSLIDRSGMSQAELARRIGFSHTSGLNAYMRPVFGDKPIPADILKKLIPHLKGKGLPPITVEEITALAGLPATVIRLPAPRTTPGAPDVFLPVRYRVEVGAYFKLEQTKGLGTAPIGASASFIASAQFVAVIGGAYIHCVEPTMFAAGQEVGRRALVAVLFEKTGLVELKLVTLNGKPPGKVLGIVIGGYFTE